MTKHIIFDWNGTLQDDLQYIYTYGVVHIFQIHHIEPPTLEEYRDEVTSDFMESVYWPRGIPRTTTAADLNAIMHAKLAEEQARPELFPDAVETLRRLHGARCAMSIVSAYDQDRIEEALVHNGINPGIFTVIYGSAHTKAYSFAFIQNGYEADAYYVIGDGEDEIAGAVATGCLPYLYMAGFTTYKKVASILDKYPAIPVYTLTEFADRCLS